MPSGETAASTLEALSPALIFLWAAGGSIALEIISLLNNMRAERTGGIPSYYRDWSFWLVRIAVAAIAGALAVAEKASSPMIAINIGASAPAILQLLTSPPKQT